MKVEEVKPIEIRKKIFAGVLALLAVLALSWGGYKLWIEFSDPPMPETVDDIEDLLADSRYQNMSREQRRAYQEHMNEMFGSLNEDERRRLGELVRSNEAAMREAIDMGMEKMREMYRNTIADAETEQQRDQMLDEL